MHQLGMKPFHLSGNRVCLLVSSECKPPLKASVCCQAISRPQASFLPSMIFAIGKSLYLHFVKDLWSFWPSIGPPYYFKYLLSIGWLQGGGIFCNPRSKSSPAKLRLLYEAAPMAFIVEAAGGSSHDGKGSILDRKIESVQDKTSISLGSKVEVERSVKALQYNWILNPIAKHLTTRMRVENWNWIHLITWNDTVRPIVTEGSSWG